MTWLCRIERPLELPCHNLLKWKCFLESVLGDCTKCIKVCQAYIKRTLSTSASWFLWPKTKDALIEGDTIVNNDDDNEGGFAKNDEEDENVIYRACSDIRDTFGLI